MDQPWGNSSQHQLKIERIPHCFETLLEDEDSGFSRKKTARDPLSHRIIEKRRRDRMNSCLADLSKLIPSTYLKKARGRIEKTEIIEMAIKHLKHLQAHACRETEKCDLALKLEYGSNISNQFHCGYQECMSETMHFLVEMEGFYASDAVCVRLLSHLQKHCDKLTQSCDYKLHNRRNPTNSNKNVASSVVDGNTKETNNSSHFTYPNKNHNGNMEKRHQDNSSDHNISSKFTFPEFMERTNCFVQDRHTGEIKESKQTSEMEINMQEDQKPFHSLWYSTNNEGNIFYKNELNKSKDESINGNESEEQLQNQDHRYSPFSQDNLPKSRPLSVNSSGSSSRSDEVYKFKTNIKHRFNADLQQHTALLSQSESRCDLDMENGNNNLSVSDCSQIMDQNTKSIHQVNNTSPLIDVTVWKTLQPKMDTENQKVDDSSICFSNIASEKVPIFVLHPKGTFYLPMTIDGKIVNDLLNKFPDSAPILHPVSITVYFGNASCLSESASRTLPHISLFNNN